LPRVFKFASQSDPACWQAGRCAVSKDSSGIRAHILLAKLYRAVGRFDDAQALAKQAMARSPYRYEPEEILGSIAAVQKNWKEAAAHYKRVLDLSSHLKITPPYAQLAMIFENAGMPRKARAFRQKAQDE